ncbi:MAG: aminoglycoside phosphotransferase family protein, partial [Geitlerinemataceae cyanobacterium]
HLGCLDRRLDRLKSQIDDLFNHETVLSQLKAAELDKLHALAPSLKRLCLQLANYNIPQTLVHGDLHLGNVALHKDSYLFFDWTDSCISHPFFDLFQLFFYPKVQIFSATIPKLRDEYLSQWTLYEPIERLREAWALAKPLCALHHAITYQHIVACLEPRAQQECNAIPKFLRSLLKCSIPHSPN